MAEPTDTVVSKPLMDALFRQPPKKAIDYLQQKQVMLSQDWFEAQGNAHNKAFVIAHMTQMDLLQDIKQSLLDAQAKGINLKDWSAQAEQLMRAKGWWGKKEITTADGTREVQLGSPYRLKTIYQTNMAQAYEAGRQSVMWNDQDTLFPYVMYSAILDSETRLRHLALHGVLMLKSDPAWQAIAAKNGYNCRCTNIELMQADVDAGGYKVRSSDGFFRIDTIDVKGGGIAQVARLEFPDLPAFATDAGWVGRPTDSPLGLFFEKATKVDPKIAAQSAAKVLQNQAVVDDLNSEVKAWIQSVDVSKPRGEMKHVGAFKPIFVDAIQKYSGIQLETAVITIHDKDTVAHIAKERKTHDPEWFKNIVEHLNEPHDLYWDVRHNNAALVFDLNDESHKYKLIIQLNRQNKGRIDGERVNYVGNLIRTIVVEETSNFENGQDYILLKSFDEKN